MRHRIQLSSWRLELADKLLRLPPRPPAIRPSNYEDRYDFQTVLYDVFRDARAGSVVAVAPPLLSLEQSLGLSFRALPDGTECPFVYEYNPNFTRIVIEVPERATGLEARSAVGSVTLAIQPSLAHAFRGRRVIYTLQQDNDLVWIRDWALFYAREHGADAAIVYDNASTRYEPGEIARALQSVPGIEEVAVVDWPFPYGAFDLREELSWNLVDSIYCQFAAFDHVARRLLSEARSVLNADIDELVVRTSEATLFEAAEAAPGGYVQFEGYWVENVRDATRFGMAGARHRDFYHTRSPEPDVSEPKWAMVPARLDPNAVLSVHDIHNAYRGPAETFCLYHLKGINTMWDTDRPLIGQRREESLFDPAAHRVDATLEGALDRVFAGDAGLPAAPPPEPTTAALIARLRSGAHRRAGRFDEALSFAREAVRLAPDAPGPLEHLASLAPSAEADALRARARSLRETDFFFHLQAARRHLDFGDYEAAEASSRKCLALEPDAPEALHGLLLCWTSRNAHDKALEMAEEAVEKTPEYSTFAFLVPVFSALGKWNEAERLVRRALERNPDDPYLTGLLASVLVVMRRLKEARAQIERTRALNTPAAFRERLAIVNVRGRPSREYVEWDPLHGRLTALESQVALAERRFEAAELLACDAALRSYPDPGPVMHLGDVLERVGDEQGAAVARERAVEMAQTNIARRPPTHFGPRARLDLGRRNWLALLSVLIQTRDRERAGAALAEAREAGVLDARFLGSLAARWLAREAYEEARCCLEEAIAGDPNNPRLQDLLGRALLGLDRVPEAVAARREAVRLDPAQVGLWLALAEVLARTGETGEAETALREALRREPGNALAHHRLARLAITRDALTQAEACERAAIRLDPDNPGFHEGLAHVLTLGGRVEEAIDALQRATELADTPSERTALNLANLLVRAGRLDEAESMARVLLDRHPEHVGARSIIDALSRRRDRGRVAAPGNGGADEAAARADAAFRRARRLIGEGRTAEAESPMRQALDASPGNAGLHAALAGLLLELDRPAEALEAIEAAIARDGRSAAYHFRRANALARLRRVAESEAAHREAIRLDPGQAVFRVGLANVLLAQHRPDEAADALREAVRLDPSSEPTRARLDELLQRLANQGA